MLRPRAHAARRPLPLAVPLAAMLAAMLPAASGCRPAPPDAAAGGTASDGQPPAAVAIGRVMADPRVVPDERGEWIELRNAGTDTVELRGWRLRSANDRPYALATSLRVAPGAVVVLGRSADRAANGGVAVAHAYGDALTLANGADWLALEDARGRTVDSVAWSSAPRGEAFAARPAPPPGDSAPPTLGPPTGVIAELVVRVLDVGQGDAIYVENGDSRAIIDGGPDAGRFGRLLDSLDLNGRTIDVVVLTHPHYDHHAGLRELFRTRRQIRVRYFFENRDAYPNAALDALRDSVAAREERGELTVRDTDDPCGDGRPACTVRMRGGALLHVLRPLAGAADVNDRSAPVKLVGPDSAAFTMWLAGDAERAAVDWFDRTDYDRRPGMDVDVLKLDHHGSCDGSTARYLALTTPAWAVASLAGPNDYGYLHAQTKTLLREHRVPWYRTDVNGTVTIRAPGTPGSGFTVTPARGPASADGRSDRRSTQEACRTM
jgi:competence protein ComEC